MSKTVVDRTRSKFETSVWKQLLHDKKGTKLKEIDYEREHLPYVITATYTPDFILTLKDGSKIYIEAKGWLKHEDRRKLLLIKEQHPDLDLRLVFQQDNKLSKKGLRYSDWANTHGFTYAVGFVPKEWFGG